MSFLSPIFFWSFLFLIPLAAVYFLKVRPRKEPTTALFLWQSIYQKKQTNSLFNKLRDLISLLIMALIFILLTMAMAGPEFNAGDDKDLLLVIDNSASMSAIDNGNSRLELAREQARSIITALGAGHRAAIATASAAVEYKTFMSDNQRMLYRAIDEVAQSDLAFDSGVIEKVLAKNSDSSQVRTILISDACSISKDFGHNDNESDGLVCEILKVGTKVGNIGISACDIQVQKSKSDQMAFYFQLVSSFDKPIDTQVTLYYLASDKSDDTNIIDSRYLNEDFLADLVPDKVVPVTVLPGENKPEIYYLSSAMPGRWLAVLEYDDAMSIDNYAAMAVNIPDPVQVCVCEDYFFDNCVDAFSLSSRLIRLVREPEENSPVVYLCQSIPEYEQLLSSNAENIKAVVFNLAKESKYFTGSGAELETGTFAVKTIAKEHPALSFYDVSLIPFYGAVDIGPVPAARTLVETDTHTGLIWQMSDDRSDAFFVNMNPAEGDFYYSPYFPVMVFRMVLALAGTERLDASSFSTNEMYHKNIGINYTNMGLSIFSGYHKANGPESQVYGCSLLSGAESMLNCDFEPEIIEPIKKGHSISYWLIAVALMLGVTESVLYHRRKLG